jgi:UMF1 family MFS transporter
MPLIDTAALNPGVRRREVLSWAGYDFANSGYTTVVLTAVFNAYFVSVVANGADWRTAAWTLTLAVSNTAVMIAMPIIGAYADLRARKQWLLRLSTIGCVASTAALALAGRGDVAIAVVAIVISNFFFQVGVSLIGAFLPEIARPNALGKVSGWGWSFGYLGGLATLAVCLAYVMWAQGQGRAAEDFVPVTMLITAGIFALASLPTLFILKERAIPQSQASLEVVRSSMSRLVCGAFYQAGVAVVIALAAIYADEVMQFSYNQTIMLVLVVNITAAIGAFAFGYMQDLLGHKQALALTLVLWIAMTAVASLATTATLFWISANLAGLAMGSSQSAGRAMVGLFAPSTRLAEFYGLWTLAVQVAAIVGPLTYGIVVYLTDNNHRLGMMITGGFFVIGLLLIASIDIGRGRAAKEAAA